MTRYHATFVLLACVPIVRAADAPHLAPPVTALAYHSDGAWLAAGTYGEVLLLNAAGDPAGRLATANGPITALTVGPHGRLLAVAGGHPGTPADLRIYLLDGPRPT